MNLSEELTAAVKQIFREAWETRQGTVVPESEAKLIRAEGGVITAYDGDRIMAIYIGGSKNTNAARTALKINYAVTKIINPALKECYPSSSYGIKHVVGIDTSPLLVTRTGVRGANDLVWVGKAANHAAKLSALPATFASRITKRAYESLHPTLKVTNAVGMWEKVTWTPMDQTIYRSNWTWALK